MATRSFKRDTRGRFARSDTRGDSAARKRRSAAERSADQAAERASELKQERAAQKADQAVTAAESALKEAEAGYRKAKKTGGDDALETAWDRRVRAHEKLAQALRRRARVAQ